MEKPHIEGVPAADIAMRLGISKRMVYSKSSKGDGNEVEDRLSSGWPKTASTSEVVKRIREKVRRNSRSFMRELTRDEGD